MNCKYNCDKCDLHTNAKSVWDKHLISGLHLTGKRAVRCDKKVLDKCPHYFSSNIILVSIGCPCQMIEQHISGPEI